MTVQEVARMQCGLFGKDINDVISIVFPQSIGMFHNTHLLPGPNLILMLGLMVP